MSNGAVSHTLARYLSDGQKLQLAQDLSGNLENEQNVEGLIEILDSLDVKSVESVSSRLVKYLKELILSGGETSGIESLLKLLSKLPVHSKELLNWLHDSIVSTLQSRLNYLFDPKSIELLSDNDVTISSDLGDEVDVDYSLTFLEKVFSLETIEISQKLDRLVLMLLTIKEESLSRTASKLLKWRTRCFIENEKLVWSLIFHLMQSENTYHITNGFIQWLRFLIYFSKTSKESTSFNELIKDDQYWTYIQNGLSSSTHDHKKYSLSILKLSIQHTQVDLNNSLVSFEVSKRDENINQWKRFCTLYEIVGVDTALNQAEAAKGDILKLLSLDSYIKPSWCMAMLCTGFTGSMESVRKFSMNLMYAVPRENSAIFAHEFFTSIFLKYCIEAPHFQVNRTDTGFECPYGEQLESFVEKVLLSLRKDTQKLELLITQLLELLVESTTYFAPARIYLTSGIIKGLKSQKVLKAADLAQIYKLFNSTAEDDAFEIYLQSLHLMFLRNLKPNVPLLIESLTQFVLFNGYDIFYDRLEIFLDYVAAYYAQETDQMDYLSKSPEYQVIYFALFGVYDTKSVKFLKELASSGYNSVTSPDLSSKYITLMTELISNPNQSDYSKATGLVELSIFKNSWTAVDLSLLFNSIKNGDYESFDQDRFKFFDKVYLKYSEVTRNDHSSFSLSFEELVELFEKLDKINVNFKAKDSIMGSFLNIFLNFLKLTPLENNQLDQLIQILQKSMKSAFYHTILKTCLILQYLFSNYTQSVDLISSVEILESTWDFVTGERLILKQRDMHLTFIETLFHPTLLKDTINNEFNAKIVRRIGLEIISYSYTRRSFLPCLSKCLLQYSLGYKLELEQTEWIIEMLYLILNNVQDGSNLFTVKSLICSKYDREISFEGNLYEKIFGAHEVSSKINIISILSSSSNDFVSNYYSKLIDEDPFTLIKPKKRIDSVEEVQRIYGFSSLLLVIKKLNPETLSYYVSNTFLPLLSSESSPLVRSYIEWIIAIDLVQSLSNRQNLFNLFEEHHKPTLVTSVERIAFLVSQRLSNDQLGYQFFENFTRYLIPNCASNKPLIRHFSNSLCLSLYPEIKSKNVELPVEPVLLKLYEDAKKSESTGKYRSGDALTWNVEEDFTLTSIFGGVLKRISPRDIKVFISRDEFEKYISKENLDISIGVFKSPNWSTADREVEEDLESKLSNSTLQTKSGAWEAVLDFDEQQRSIKRTDLIVVSSLVDKPPNLGGICRLCDVLGTGLMTVDDMRVTKHPQFKNVAVTADYWMPMTEVNIDNIADFMKEKKKEGYTLIGLEQTDKSIVLGPETRFPKKSLFLLGREAEGIPGDLLAELDYCIEIRQRGVIRSMNIQTATAVLVHAYSSTVE